MSQSPAPIRSPRPTAPDRADVPVRARCPHCGTAVEGQADSFCCAGCEMAHAIICGAGLEQYYQNRTAYAPRPQVAATN